MSRGVEYNPAVIQTFADRLYRRARTIQLTYTLLGLLLGGLLPTLAARGASITAEGGISGTWVVVGLAIGGVIGYAIGSEKGLLLRLQAQQLLCNVSIEHNTRQAILASQYGHPAAPAQQPTHPPSTPQSPAHGG